MFRSDSINEIAGALAQAQLEMDNANLNSVNPHFKSKYADLPSVREAIIGPLNRNGIALSQIPSLNGQGTLELTSILMHSPSGQYIGGDYPLPTSGKPHEIGSAITYARRYMAAAMAFVAADEDDDGNAAQNAKAPAPASPAVVRNVANEAKALEKWQAPDLIPFDGNYVTWGTTFAERLRMVNGPGEIQAWFDKNERTVLGAKDKAPRVYARLIALGGESGTPTTKADQDKTDARDSGTAKSATDGSVLEVFRLALDAASTDAEIDAVCTAAKMPKSLVAQAGQMAELRRKQLSVPA